MGYSHKRLKQLLFGKVQYCILLGDQVVFSSKSLKVAISHADMLQRQNPGTPYEMKLMEVDQ